MRIGFDAKRIAQNRTGLGNYGRFLLQGLLQHATDEYFLFIPNEKKQSALPATLSETEHVTCVYPTTFFSRMFRSAWRSLWMRGDIQNQRLDIFHGLSGELPLCKQRNDSTKYVVTIHDVIFRHFPQYYKPISRWIYDYKFRRATQMADCVIAITECTKRDIMEAYGTPEGKIKVLYQGCDERFQQVVSAAAQAEVSKQYRLPENYMLYVGSVEERKNLMLVLRAMAKIKDKMHLVVVGRITAYGKQAQAFVKENNLSDYVHFLQSVKHEDLPAIYQQARVFVYPSRYEGFGIPILEALCSGVPVIACTGSCLEEAGGKDSIYVHPDNVDAMCKAIERVWNDEAERERMIVAGKAYAERFQKQALTQELHELYKQLL